VPLPLVVQLASALVAHAPFPGSSFFSFFSSAVDDRCQLKLKLVQIGISYTPILVYLPQL